MTPITPSPLSSRRLPGVSPHVDRIPAVPGFPLDPSKTFHTFVWPSGGMRLRVEAARYRRGRRALPLCVIGSHGRGKSHLLQAIAADEGQRDPGFRATYLPAGELDDLIVFARREGGADLLMETLAAADLVLVDGIESSEESEFLRNLVSRRTSGGKRTVLSGIDAKAYDDLGLLGWLQERTTVVLKRDSRQVRRLAEVERPGASRSLFFN